MTEKLKDFYDARMVRSIAAELRRAHPSFREESFVRACLRNLDDFELMGRGRHIAEVMYAHLPRPFAAAADVLVASLGPELAATHANGLGPFRYLPHSLVVREFGLSDFEPSMRAQYEITKRFSAEFSIRPFLERYPDAAYARLMAWTDDPSPHVRRLVSEGSRARLPWAPRLKQYIAEPAPVLALLERLRDDPERYVQRSVANSLNDIAKDHAELAVATCRRWAVNAGPGRRYIVRHALRSLVKDGHRGALAVLGAGARPRVEVSRVRLTPRRVLLGRHLEFAFRLHNVGASRQDLLVDYAVHFVKANGDLRAKVFKLRTVTLDAGHATELSGRVSFAAMTTRRHYEGRHRLEILVNGVRHPLGEFDVRA